MTRSTVKTLWFAGGGLLATSWFAVTPSGTTPVGSATAAVERPAQVKDLAADDLDRQEARLRNHAGAVPPDPSIRNPFRFGSKQPRAEVPAQLPAAALAAPTRLPAAVAMSLSGIAERQTSLGVERTAIISHDGQLYLVTVGETVDGRYRVVAVDSDAVTLTEDNGNETRLVLH